MSKRIILIGPAAAGKDFMKNKFRARGFKCDCSYTTRPQREGEIEGVDYYFTPSVLFHNLVNSDRFYEHVKHGEYEYGTGKMEWETSDVFIMECDGLLTLSPEDRASSMIIYVNAPQKVRIQRMKDRGWTLRAIMDRLKVDKAKFENLDPYYYDVMVNSVEKM